MQDSKFKFTRTKIYLFEDYLIKGVYYLEPINDLTPLHIACATNDIEEIKIHILDGIKVDCTSPRLNTPLMMSVFSILKNSV